MKLEGRPAYHRLARNGDKLQRQVRQVVAVKEDREIPIF
jgi:hypothetical protein